MNWDELEQKVQEACKVGLLEDWRRKLPWSSDGKPWKQRLDPSDILGCCIHHSASDNQDPFKTNEYHLGANHVSQSGAPHILYSFGISRDYDRALLFNSLSDITWSQGRPELPGDENRHLLSILVFGDFDSPGHEGKSRNPSGLQMRLLDSLCDWLRVTLGIVSGGWFGHKNFGKAECPGDYLMLKVQSMRKGWKGFSSDKEWQEALLRWDPSCLPRGGADGIWGYESKRALSRFESRFKQHVDGIQDPFTELLLVNKYGY